MRGLPRTFWLLLGAAAALGIAGLVNEDPVARAVCMLASVANVLAALLTLVRTRREREQRERDGRSRA